MKRLAIVGMGSGFREAPWFNPRYDCWTLNAAWGRLSEMKRCWKRHAGQYHFHWPPSLTAWFELHSPRYLKQEWAGDRAHVKALEKLTVPVYVQEAHRWKRLAHPVTFPRRAIGRQFPRGDYHAGSLDWMLAFALFRGYRRIDCYGVNLGPTDSGEPLSARSCFEYWVGVAEGRGATVKVHAPTGAFWIYNYARHTTPYHYDDTWRLVEERR